MQFPRPPRPGSLRGSAERGLNSLRQVVAKGKKPFRSEGKPPASLSDSGRNLPEGNAKSNSQTDAESARTFDIKGASTGATTTPPPQEGPAAADPSVSVSSTMPKPLGDMMDCRGGGDTAIASDPSRKGKADDRAWGVAADATTTEANGLRVAHESESPGGVSSSTPPVAPRPEYTTERPERDEAFSGVHRRDNIISWDSEVEEHEVWLHVYDLGPVTGRLNEFVLRGANLGAFHCGIEVLGDEWSFQGFHDAWDDPTLSGVVRNEPRLHPAYIYRESLFMGVSPLDKHSIDYVLDSMMEEWPANMYHIVSRNCVTFAEEFAKALQAPEEFPPWVRGAMDACKQPTIKAIADYGWSVFKEWSRRQAEQEALAEAEAEEREAREAEAAMEFGGGLRH